MPGNPAIGLEPTDAELRTLIAAATSALAQYVSTLPKQPASETESSGSVASSLTHTLPEGPTDFAELLQTVMPAAQVGFNSAGPGYLAYIPGGGLVSAAIADLLANGLNRYTGVWVAAPGLVTLETNVLRWMCDLIGFSSYSLGFLTSGGSMATFSAVFTARREKVGDALTTAVVLGSDQCHHSVAKAAMLAGIPGQNVVGIATEGGRLLPDAVRAQIAAERAAGRRPFLLVANAGTTNTGAIDDLPGLAQVAREEDLWLHVDAAYGGFFLLTSRGKKALAGIAEADSVTLDPHKGLFLPYGTGALLVRDGPALARAHHVTAAYMPAMQDDIERVDFAAISPELSRDYRGLRVWLPLRLHGVAAFREALDEKLDLAREAAARLAEFPGVEIVAAPVLSLLAFRAVGSDALNRRWLEGTNARRRVMLTGTTFEGRFVLRICVLSFRTHAERMEEAMVDLSEALAAARTDG